MDEPTEVAGTELTVAAAAGLPATIDLEQDAGRGIENATTDDMALPFLKVAQALTAEMKKQKASYIEGLEQGDFFNNVTRQVWAGDAGVFLVPVYYTREYLEWGPEVGDGLKGKHGPDILAQTTKGGKNGKQDVLESGNVIVVTGTWYVLIVNPETGDVEPAVIGLASTQLKQSRALVTKLASVKKARADGKGVFNPPIFYNVLHATAAAESKGDQDWYGWRFAVSGAERDAKGAATGIACGAKQITSVLDLPNGAAIYARAKALNEMAAAGKLATVSPEADGGENDEEIPF